MAQARFLDKQAPSPDNPSPLCNRLIDPLPEHGVERPQGLQRKDESGRAMAKLHEPVCALPRLGRGRPVPSFGLKVEQLSQAGRQPGRQRRIAQHELRDDADVPVGSAVVSLPVPQPVALAAVPGVQNPLADPADGLVHGARAARDESPHHAKHVQHRGTPVQHLAGERLLARRQPGDVVEERGHVPFAAGDAGPYGLKGQLLAREAAVPVFYLLRAAVARHVPLRPVLAPVAADLQAGMFLGRSEKQVRQGGVPGQETGEAVLVLVQRGGLLHDIL